MKLGSLFDGIGGFPLVGTWLGIDPVWASEIEPAPISITKRNLPTMKHLGDITRINGGEIEPVDIITFGSPCQNLSVAGNREGLAGSESGLFMEAIRIIKEMREATNGIYPRFIVWENVLGALSSQRGRDFQTVLSEITETDIPMPKSGRWAAAGMVRTAVCDLAWRVFDAQYWGCPQHRERIFLVGDFRDNRRSEILFESESVHGHFAQSQPEGERATADTGSDADRTSIPFVERAGKPGGGKGILIGKDKSFTLSAAQTQRVLCGSLRSQDHGHLTYCLQGNGIDRADTAGCNGKGWKEEHSYTLNTVDRHAVCCMNTLDTMHDQQAVLIIDRAAFNQGENAQYDFRIGDNDTMPTLVAKGPHAVMNNIVRRITPRECERLQGFPDDWTLYGADDEIISDTQRYKALGNSVALPCVEFVLGKIKEEEE